MTDGQDGLDVMVLDDEPLVGDRLKPALEGDGHRVEAFTDPRAALARVDDKKFDVVITDIRMDNVNGIEVLERVVSKDPRTKVIIITGFATMELAREAMAKYAFDFVAKPFKLKEMREIVKSAAKALAAGE